jgi:hypothetical protein
MLQAKTFCPNKGYKFLQKGNIDALIFHFPAKVAISSAPGLGAPPVTFFDLKQSLPYRQLKFC